MTTPIPTNSATLTAFSAAAATGGRVFSVRGEGRVARGVTTDSRAVQPGSAFVALRGERHDGHDHIEEALGRGACLLVVERVGEVDVGAADVVAVADALQAWADIARAHIRAWRRGRPLSSLVAITGSAGKTTTKELCAALLRAAGGCLASAGNLNNRVGVPAVALGLETAHRFAVFEVGMSVRGEIAALARVLEPDVAVLTNVGVAHAAGVGGSRADVAREKGDLLASLGLRGTAVVPLEDGAAMGQLARTRAGRVLTFGLSEAADYRLVERRPPEAAACRLSSHLVVARRDETAAAANLPLLGEAAALDFTAALAAAETVAGRLDDATIERALREHLERPSARMQVRRLANGSIVLDDTYNANPDSMRSALRTVAELAAGRRVVAVLGEMRELGELAAEEHENLGSEVAGAGASLVVSCGGWADRTARSGQALGVEALFARDAEEAARLVMHRARPGDVTLVKASRGVGAERVVAALVHSGGGEVGLSPEGR